MVHTDGLLRLGFALDARGRSCLVSRAQRFPLHLTNPLYLDASLPGMAFVYAQNPTGGVFGGDRLTIEVNAGCGTEVHLTSTSSTKAYRSESGDANEFVALTVSRDAYLEFMPEPLIPQAGARLRQHVSVDLDEGAAFLMADVVSPGRAARGEIFGYDKLERRTVVRRCGSEIAVDALRFEPRTWPPGQRGVFGGYTYLASVLAVAPPSIQGPWRDQLIEAAHDLPGVLAGAGALPGEEGVVVRILSESLMAATVSIDRIWGIVRSAFDKGAPPRKRK